MMDQKLTNRIDDISAELNCLRDQQRDINREIDSLSKEKEKLINDGNCTHSYPDGEHSLSFYGDISICEICEQEF